MSLDRRQFLIRSGLTGAGALGAAGRAAAAPAHRPDGLAADGPLQRAVAADPAARLPAVPFHGVHQAGILTAPPPAACFAAADVTAAGRLGLAGLLRALTGSARALTAGGAAPAGDSGTLGPVPAADGLTITVGVGASLFDHRFGLAGRWPPGLTVMHSFRHDALDPAQCGGDLILSICAGSRDTVLHALRELSRATRGALRLRWRMDGFVSPARPDGVPRNHHGFKDGIANPDVRRPEVAGRLLWIKGAGAHAWSTGGTYQVIRTIRMFTEAWDELPVGAQERIVGRRRDSGAPLGARRETDVPDYAADPHGWVTPLDAHIRLANPRTPAAEGSRILRRGYNYDRGLDAHGRLDMGLIFNCFQRDVVRQFEAVQKRLEREPMAPFVSPFGGGYFLVLPGVREPAGWLGQSLLA